MYFQTESGMVAARVLGAGRTGELLFGGYRVSAWEDQTLWGWTLEMVAPQQEYT